MPRSDRKLGSLLVTVVLLLSGLGVLTVAPPAHAASTSGAKSPPALPSDAVTHYLQSLPPEMWTAEAHASDSQIHNALNGTAYASLPPSSVRSFASNVTPLLSLADPWQAFESGCQIGVITGFIGGCLITGAAAAVAVYLATLFANGESAVELQFGNAEASAFDNAFVYTNGLVLMSESVLNSTFNAWAAMADSVATQQLPNSTFDVLADMNASGVAGQQATVVQVYANALGSGVSSFNAAYEGSYAPTEPFASGCHYSILASFHSSSPIWGCNSGTNRWYQAAGAVVETSLTNGTGLQINQGGHAWLSCTGGPTNAYLNSVGTLTANGVRGGTVQYVIPSGITAVKITPTFTGIWRLNYPAGSCDVFGLGILGIPPAAGNPTSQIDVAGCGISVVPNATLCDPSNPNLAGSFRTAAYGSFGNYHDPATLVSPTYTVGGTTAAFFTEENSLMVGAETNARTYWTFLHILGYTSVSQIPSNCIIPMPNQILPPQYDAGLGSLTLNQSLALYEAWMNGLATFFNTPLNATNFCSGHQPFKVADAAWNLNTEVTGFIYTLPVAHQTFGTKSTWTVTNASVSSDRVGNASSVGLRTDPTPFVIWPTVKTLYVPIGKVQEVPVDDPLQAFVPGNATFYTLLGNGTAAGTHGFSNGTTSASAGTAIYIATCLVRNDSGTYVNPPGSYCPLTLSSIQNVTFNVSCFSQSSTGNCGTTGFLAGGICSSGIFLWSTLVNAYATVVGSSALGCLIADGLAIVTLVLLVAALVVVVGLVVRRR